MKVLVIGGTGSISREVVQQLVTAGYETTVYNRGQRVAQIDATVRRLSGDRFDYAAFEAQMAQERFDVVIDMIAYTDQDAASTVRAFRGRAEQLIITSSIACYKRPFHKLPPISEAGNEYFDSQDNLYGLNKAKLEQYLFAVMPELDDLKITIVRPSLTFGRGGNNLGIFRQNYGLVKRIREGKPVVMFGDGQTPMNFTFTPDAAAGYVALVGKPQSYGQAYHVNSMEYATWESLYQTLGKVVGRAPQIVHIPTELLYAAAPNLNSHLYHDKQWVNLFDSTKAQREVGFAPKLTVEAGLRWLVEWYDVGNEQVVKAEIEEFEDKLVALHGQWKQEISGLLP